MGGSGGPSGGSPGVGVGLGGGSGGSGGSSGGPPGGGLVPGGLVCMCLVGGINHVVSVLSGTTVP